MIKIGELELYSTWIKDLHGHIVRIDGPGLGNKKRMIVTLIPKQELIVLLGGLCVFSTDPIEDSMNRQINDQFNTEINITRYSKTVAGSDRIYRVLIKSGQSVIRSDITQDQLETLIANIKVAVHRDIE